jgi:MFS superfamily sulfate permease-like transporter
MNSTMAWITGIAAFVPVLALAAVHIVFARQLLQDPPDDSR